MRPERCLDGEGQQPFGAIGGGSFVSRLVSGSILVAARRSHDIATIRLDVDSRANLPHGAAHWDGEGEVPMLPVAGSHRARRRQRPVLSFEVRECLASTFVLVDVEDHERDVDASANSDIGPRGLRPPAHDLVVIRGGVVEPIWGSRVLANIRAR